MRLLVTRPGEQGERSAQALRRRGHEVLIAPVLKIEPNTDADFGAVPYAAVLMTSANAAHALLSHLRRATITNLPLLVVGEATRSAAHQAGFSNIVSVDGDVAALAALAVARVPRGRQVLYLAGEVVAGDLAGALEAAGIAVRTVTLYRAIAQASLPPSVIGALRHGEIDGVLHYSRRSAATFLTLAKAAGIDPGSLDCSHFCLSRHVAEPLFDAGLSAIAIAARPDEAALLELVGVR